MGRKYEILEKMLSDSTDTGMLTFLEQGETLEQDVSFLWDACIEESQKECLELEAKTSTNDNPTGLPKLSLKLIDTSSGSSRIVDGFLIIGLKALA